MLTWRFIGTTALVCLLPHAITLATEAELRLALSEDGLEFSPQDVSLIRGASAPDLEALPNGDLILMFDLLKRGTEQATMHMSISHDQGKTWSKAQPIVVNDPSGRPVDGRHPELIRTADGNMRLYFTISGPRRSRDRKLTLIRTAGTSSGTKFQIDGSIPKSKAGRGESHATAIRMGSRIHLFVDQPYASSKASDSEAGHFVSRDGTRFSRKTSPRLPRPGLVGSIIRAKEGMRAYVTTKDGIRSLVSSNAVIWKDDPGLRIKSASDPAVARLPDGKYLMVYCSSETSSQGKFAIEIDGDHPTPADSTGSDADDSVSEGDTGADNPIGPDLSTEETTEAVPDDQEFAEVNDRLPPDSPLYDFIEDPWVDDFGFAPRPNFQQRIDYVEWWKEQLAGQPTDNAYEHYQAVAQQLSDIFPASTSARPSNMFNDRAYDQPPGPWSPSEHPDWEASNLAVQSLIDQYRQAATHSGYAQNVDDADQSQMTDENGNTTLALMTLPSLHGHREMTKAILADAWRTEDGTVSGNKMMDAWKTTLQSSAHLNQGTTLIEELVSISQRTMIHDNARRALQQNVFADDQLESALDTLKQYDPRTCDPAKSVRGEYAFTMDVLQQVFWPDKPGGKPVFRPERVGDLISLDEEDLKSIQELNDTNLADMLESFDSYYHDLGEAMSTGYPEMRADDIHAISEDYLKDGRLPRFIVPDLSRVHLQRTRIEASRRATQLSYAVRIYRNRHGTWPESLDAVSSEFGYEMTTDPFTGDYFSYQLTDDGPKIYSLGDNGIDDGGHYQARWGDRSNQAQGDDGVFWPPQQ